MLRNILRLIHLILQYKTCVYTIETTLRSSAFSKCTCVLLVTSKEPYQLDQWERERERDNNWYMTVQLYMYLYSSR